jgi:hypothetical protein
MPVNTAPPPTHYWLEGEKQKILWAKKDIIYNFELQYIIDTQTNNFKPGIQKKNYGDDSKYLGQMLGADRQGWGIYYYPTGDIYAGEWEGSTFHGTGTYIFASGERYEGGFDAFKKHGRGVYYYLNGNTYEGEWKLDKKHGKGVYTYLATNGNFFYTSQLKKPRKIRWPLGQLRPFRARRFPLLKRRQIRRQLGLR